MQDEVKEICRQLRQMAEVGIVHHSESEILEKAAMCIEWYDSQIRFLNLKIDEIGKAITDAGSLAEETGERIGIAFEGDPDMVIKQEAYEVIFPDGLGTEPEWEGDPANGYWLVCGECHGWIGGAKENCPHCGAKIDWKRFEI